MNQPEKYEVIIIGGSYSGLSAAMTLGRALRKVLVIDAGKPCNRSTPHSHNLITHDGDTPEFISKKAKEQVKQYDTVTFLDGFALKGKKLEDGFHIKCDNGQEFVSQKLIFASGLRDIMPAISGFAACWGISVIHCPYCHGYEVRKEKTGVLANGDAGFELAKLISNWTNELTLFTNGKSTLSPKQTSKLTAKNIQIEEEEIETFEHTNGYLKQVTLKSGKQIALKAIYARPDYEQSSSIPASLGCEIAENGLLKVDGMRETTVSGVFACGDNSAMRSLPSSLYTGSLAGATVNHALINESF